MKKVSWLVTAAVASGVGTSVWAGNGVAPVGEPVLERATLRSLGAYWVVRGDENQNASVTVEYRKVGEQQWRAGPPLFRVERGMNQGPDVKVPADGWLLAGSVVMLDPATKYELKLVLSDADGGSATKVLAAETKGEPVAPRGGAVYHVVPGNGNGDGSAGKPIRGIATANSRAKPGDTFLLHAGVYSPPLHLDKSGEKGKPIVWKAAGDGEVIIDGQGGKRAMDAIGVHDVWFEGISFRNAAYALVTHESERIVVRGCRFTDVDNGIVATKNEKDTVNDYFITDNVMEGRSKWPRSEGIEDRRGIQISGAGHVVAYNTIRGFGDAIDTFQGPRCEAIDFHNNDCSLLTDDGIETDYAQRNVRVFENRLTNVFQGISTQPVYGGPVYVFRNVMYNVCLEPFKMHNGPSGAIMYHNTVVKLGGPLMLNTSKALSNCVYRNNLFVGTTDRYAFACEAKAVGCDYDYDGFAGGPWGNFMKWNGVKYRTLDEVKAKAPVEKHAVEMSNVGVFASGVKPPADEKVEIKDAPDLRLDQTAKAVDAGQRLSGFNEGYSGAAPDLGAYEVGTPLPHYGVRESSSRIAR